MITTLLQNPITVLQHVEISVNHWTQQSLQSAEPLWIFLSEHCSAAQLIDVLVPLVGVFHHQLLVRLVCSLSVLNTLASLIKWCSPAYRPYWWIREFPTGHNVSALQQHALTCETTAGFPSSHSLAFTAFVYLLLVFSLTSLCHKSAFVLHNISLLCHIATIMASLGMWLSRIYLATQFLHQCIVASLAAILLLHLFDQYSVFLYSFPRAAAVVTVVCFGLLPLVVYFAMLHMDVDPHWSVRMAFKWCSDPSYLRHEASPIFVLGRDFGYLMGVALSAPLYKRYDCKPSIAKRSSLILAFELLNYYARRETPKHRGRFVFVAYEFTRNLIHSYTLLSILPKIV